MHFCKILGILHAHNKILYLLRMLTLGTSGNFFLGTILQIKGNACTAIATTMKKFKWSSPAPLKRWIESVTVKVIRVVTLMISFQKNYQKKLLFFKNFNAEIWRFSENHLLRDNFVISWIQLSLSLSIVFWKYERGITKEDKIGKNWYIRDFYCKSF